MIERASHLSHALLAVVLKHLVIFEQGGPVLSFCPANDIAGPAAERVTYSP